MQTWATRHPAFASELELPQQSEVAVDALPNDKPSVKTWSQQIDKLLIIRQLEDDWDGQGTPAPTVEVVDSALVLAILLRQDGVIPPTGIVQGVVGEVVFDWQSPDGKYVEVEVTGPYKADVFIHQPGQPIKHLQWEVTRVAGAAS